MSSIYNVDNNYDDVRDIHRQGSKLTHRREFLNRKSLSAGSSVRQTSRGDSWNHFANKILLVEDDADVAHGIKLRMEAHGYEVSTAKDAVFAVSSAVSNLPDVLVLDINLPGGSGITVARRLQDMASTANIPVIFITASKEPRYAKSAEELNAVAFLEKPFSSFDLLDAIRSLDR